MLVLWHVCIWMVTCWLFLIDTRWYLKPSVGFYLMVYKSTLSLFHHIKHDSKFPDLPIVSDTQKKKYREWKTVQKKPRIWFLCKPYGADIHKKGMVGCRMNCPPACHPYHCLDQAVRFLEQLWVITGFILSLKWVLIKKKITNLLINEAIWEFLGSTVNNF